jgi:hypothetical protein
MKINLKECYGCRKPSVIWKNHEGFRYCKNCWSCHKSNLVAQKPTENLVPVVLPDIKKRPRIKLKSDKQKALDKAYSLMREEFMNKNSLCKVSVSPQCSKFATDIHHIEGRGIQTLTQLTWIPTCRFCHNWIHEHPEEARILKFLK